MYYIYPGTLFLLELSLCVEVFTSNAFRNYADCAPHLLAGLHWCAIRSEATQPLALRANHSHSLLQCLASHVSNPEQGKEENAERFLKIWEEICMEYDLFSKIKSFLDFH